MKHYGIDSQYLLAAESAATLPSWDTIYKRSFVYVEEDNRMYYGTNTGWAAWGTSGTSGSSGSSGSSGVSGTSGTSGSGTSGSSGSSGLVGTSGSSGSSGVAGTSGSSGTAGTSGTSPVTKIFQASNTTATNMNSTTPAAVPWEVESVKDDYYTHSNSTNPSRITISTTGWYRISYNIVLGAASSATDIRTRIRTDGSTYLTDGYAYAVAVNSTNSRANSFATVLVQLTANQYIEIMGDRAGSSGTWNTLSGASTITIELVR